MNKYTEYAEKVVNGDSVVCEYVRLAAKRFLDWFKRDDLEFREKKVDKVVNFIKKLKHFTGQSNGKPFILSDWQYFIVENIFGWYYKGTDKRVIRNVYIEVGRKSGKSALLSAIGLYCLLADGENGAEIDVLANSREQAHILFDMCSNFASTLDAKHKYIKPYRDKILFNATKSKMQVLSSEAATLDGYNSSLTIIDERHEAKDNRLYNVLKSSQGMRINPLMICITSAGFNKLGVCYQQRKVAIQVLYGKLEDDSQFSAIYSLDVDDDWTNPDVWIKANPNLGVTLQEDFLKEQVVQAKNNPSLEVGVRTKNFGEWLSSSDIWVRDEEILELSEKVDLSKFDRDQNCYIGVDLSVVSDLTCFSVMIPKDDKVYYKTFYYLPQSALTENSNAQLYREWAHRKQLTVTEGNTVDYDYILNDIIKVSEQLYIQEIAYDQYNATQWAINATEQGLPLKPFSQALWHFNQGTKGLEKLIKDKKVVIDNNEITRFCFSNVILKFDAAENVKPIKATNQNKIDGVISMIEALGAYLETPQYNNIIG